MRYRTEYISRQTQLEFGKPLWIQLPLSVYTAMKDAPLGFHYYGAEQARMVEVHVDSSDEFNSRRAKALAGGNLSVRATAPTSNSPCAYGHGPAVCK